VCWPLVKRVRWISKNVGLASAHCVDNTHLHMTKIEQADVSQVNGLLVQHFFRNHIERGTNSQRSLRRGHSLIPKLPEILPLVPLGHGLDLVQRRYHVATLAHGLGVLHSEPDRGPLEKVQAVVRSGRFPRVDDPQVRVGKELEGFAKGVLEARVSVKSARWEVEKSLYKSELTL
jgi:hypothetical protein